MRWFISLTIILFATPALAQEPTAAEGDRGFSLGGRIVGSFVQLSQPTDPEGEPTVLFGTAFTGYELEGGLALQKELTRVAHGPLLLDVDLLLSHARGTGYAESRTSDARREVTISATGVHVPAFINYGIEGTSTLLAVGVGPELMFGFASGSSTTQTGVEGTPQALETRPVIHVGLAAKLGMTFEVAGGYLPIELRFMWDPFVPSSTRERFDAYQSFDDTGRYGVAFDWHLGVGVGYLFEPGGGADDDAPMGTPVEAEPSVEDETPEEEPASEDQLF